MDKQDIVHIYNGILLNHEMNEIRSSAATQIDLETLILSDISQTEKVNFM